MIKQHIAFVLILVMLVTLTGCGKTDVLEENPGIPVEITVATSGAMQEHYTLSGSASPIAEATVVAKTPGKILSLNAKLGDSVSQGDLLCTLDKTDVLQTVKSLTAQLEQANAGIESARINSNHAQGSGYEQTLMQAELALSQAKSALDQAKINLDIQTTNYENMKVLYEQGNISRVNFESVQGQYQAAVSSYETAEVAYNNALRSQELAKQTAEDNVVAANSNVTSATAGRNVLLAQLESAQNSLADMDIKSPIHGVVVLENAKIGEMAAGALYQIADISKIQFKLTVPESIINQIHVGQTASVTVTSANKTVEAAVASVSPGVTAQSGGYTVVIEIDNADSAVKPGMVGTVNFLMKEAKEAILLPLETIITEDENTYVYIEKEGVVTKTPVILGMKNNETAEILEGVSIGDRVVSRGQHTVSDGVKVRVVKEHEGGVIPE